MTQAPETQELPADVPLTIGSALQLAWPIVLAQMATAATGVVDTAVMGRTGTEVDLAAVAVASVTFSFVYWAFGFLRMATTGQAAQANGRGRLAEARAVLVRALTLGAALGVGLVATFPLIRLVALALSQADPAVESGAAAYFDARIWGAPAALTGFGVLGWLLGMGRTRALLAYQVVLNGLNAVLDAMFVGVFDWGPAGIGAGTAIAEWAALGFGLFLVRDGFSGFAPLFERDRLAAMFTANRDILIRTLALLTAFAWFVNAGARTDPAAQAGNQVLLQFIAVSAFVLDAFAFVAEKEGGEAFGAGDPARLRRAIAVTTGLALGFGAIFAVGTGLLGPPIIRFFVVDVDAREAALTFLPWCALVPLLGVPAWQLDGIFLGATRGRALRNAAIAATGLYLLTDWALLDFGNLGVWVAFVAMYLYRAAALAVGLPALLASVDDRRSAG